MLSTWFHTRRRPRPSLQLELLEDRSVPAVFTVANTLDSGLGSLRQAILDANANPGDDVITFAANLNGVITLNTQLPQLSSNIELLGPGAASLTVRRSSATATPDFSVFLVSPGAVVTLSGLTIAGGRAEVGGGVRNLGTLTLKDSHVTSNTALVRGGGVANDGVLSVLNTAITANTSNGTGAGGLEVSSGTALLTNLTISGNTSTGGTGGLRFTAGTGTLRNSTIAANTAGGVSAGGGITSSIPLAMRNNIIAGNSGGSGADVEGTFASQGNNLIGKAGLTATGGASSDLFGTTTAPLDAKLGPLQNNGGPTPTHALLTGSPALDAGSNTDLPATDQRGRHRQVNGTVDIGAVEMQTGSAVVTLLQLTPSITNPAPGQPFTVTARVVDVVTGASTSPATGSVNFAVDGGAPTTIALVNGVAVFTLPSGLSAGWRYVVASYSGDDTHLTSSSAPLLLGVGIPQSWESSWTGTTTVVSGPITPAAGTDVSRQLTLDGFRSTLLVFGRFRRRGNRFFRTFRLRNTGTTLGAIRMVPTRLARGFRLVSSDVVVNGLAPGQEATFTVEIRATPNLMNAGRTPTFMPFFFAA